MKKIILFCSLLLFKIEASAQYQFFQEKTNLVFFSGIVDRQKSDQISSYYGFYGDLTMYKSKNQQFLLGTFFQISGSSLSSNDLALKNSDYEVGGGFFLGRYNPNFSSNFQSFSGLSLGITQQRDRFSVVSYDGVFTSWQRDYFLKSELNINFLKKIESKKWFSRAQFQLRLKKSLKADKFSFWNKKEIESLIWNKDYLELIFKESVFRDKFKNNTYWSPKIVSFYSYAWGDSRSFYGLGLEGSLFKRYRDDFLAVGILFKGADSFRDNYLIISLNLNINSLIKKGSSKFKIQQ